MALRRRHRRRPAKRRLVDGNHADIAPEMMGSKWHDKAQSDECGRRFSVVCTCRRVADHPVAGSVRTIREFRPSRSDIGEAPPENTVSAKTKQKQGKAEGPQIVRRIALVGITWPEPVAK